MDYKLTPQQFTDVNLINRLRETESWLNSANVAVKKWYESGRIGKDVYSSLKNTLGTFTGTGQEAFDRVMALNKAIDRSRLSFDNAGEAIGKATLKVSFWMVATTAVLGVMRKLQETYRMWKELELALERVGVTTSTVGQSLYSFFEGAADVAIRMGMPIDQTLKGMDLALRATASIATEVDETTDAEKVLENQAKRTATAQLLLRDAAILGNVAGMQFSQAIDILVGSLKQTGMELSQGILLLDKWVAVSKAAQVSVNDLAQGFAIMSSAAESAGLTVDQVNGIIAALSETVTLGPVEVGNAVRALLSTLYSESSINTLKKYGIAVKDASGELRSFWEIMSELAALSSAKILTNEQILEISRAAGAGARRYAQFAALLQNWDKAVKMTTISSQAQGDALEANQRIVDTLSNAWDQLTAAQSKAGFAFGILSGAIQDLTDLFQGLAKATSWLARMPEDLARSIKVIAELTASFVTLKIAASALTKLKVASWITGMLGLTGFGGGYKALVGKGGIQGLDPATIAAQLGISWSATAGGTGRFMVPKGATVGGKFYARPSFISEAAVGQALGGGMVAREAWTTVGQKIAGAMTKPLGTTAKFMGATMGFFIMRELTGSNAAGIGGAIGGAIGARFGIAGMAAGQLIGGLIGMAIKDATTPFADKVKTKLEEIFRDLPPELAVAVSRIREQIDLTGFAAPGLDEFRKTQENVWDKGIAKYEHALKDQQRFFDFATKYGGSAIPGVGLWAYNRTKSNIEASKQAIATLKQAREEADRLAEEADSYSTIYDKIAEGTQQLITDLHLQEKAEARIADIKQRSLELTYEEITALMSIEQAAPIAYAKIRSTFTKMGEAYTGKPEGELFAAARDQFLALYPTYEKFVSLAPEAYAPLADLMSNIASLEQQRIDAQKKINDGAELLLDNLGGQEISLLNINNQIDYWKKAKNDLLLTGVGQVPPSLAEQLMLTGLPAEQQISLALEKIELIISALESAGTAIQDDTNLTLQWKSALDLLTAAAQSPAKYLATGRMATLDIGLDTNKIAALLEKYTTMLQPQKRFGSNEETYYAFLRNEQGALTGLLGAFEAFPEVWQAMLAELEGIESNTQKMLEAEYFIPSWYATPSRYWAMKETGTHEFGPAQTGLWELWQEFLAKHNDTVKEGTTVTNYATNAQTQYTNAVNDTSNAIDTITTNAENATTAFDLLSTAIVNTTNNASTWANDITKLWSASVPTPQTSNITSNVTTPSTGGNVSQTWWYNLLDSLLGVIGLGLPHWQRGGLIPQTGPYYMHKGEMVTPTTDFNQTNNILSNSYKVQLISQEYLSNINLGILSLRQEIALLRADLTSQPASSETSFNKIVRSGYSSIGSVTGVRR